MKSSTCLLAISIAAIAGYFFSDNAKEIQSYEFLIPACSYFICRAIEGRNK